MNPILKYVLSVILILAFVISVTFSFDKKVNEDIFEMTVLSDEIEQFILKEDADTALAKYEVLNKKWNAERGKWSWMINHILIKDIDMSVSNFGHYINNALPHDAVVEKQKLTKLFKGIKDLDKIRLHNIF